MIVSNDTYKLQMLHDEVLPDDTDLYKDQLNTAPATCQLTSAAVTMCGSTNGIKMHVALPDKPTLEDSSSLHYDAPYLPPPAQHMLVNTGFIAD